MNRKPAHQRRRRPRWILRVGDRRRSRTPSRFRQWLARIRSALAGFCRCSTGSPRERLPAKLSAMVMTRRPLEPGDVADPRVRNESRLGEAGESRRPGQIRAWRCRGSVLHNAVCPPGRDSSSSCEPIRDCRPNRRFARTCFPEKEVNSFRNGAMLPMHLSTVACAVWHPLR